MSKEKNIYNLIRKSDDQIKERLKKRKAEIHRIFWNKKS